MPTRSTALASLLFASLTLACCGGGVASAAPTADPNLMGINISAPLDWEEDRLYADVIRMSRDFIRGTDENATKPSPLDSNGWPRSDFSFYAWAGIGNMNGAYTLSFKGRANVSGNPVGRIPLKYDQATDTSTGTFQYRDARASFLALRFSATKRTASSPAGTGVTDIRLMRPLAPGSSTSYPPSVLFTNPVKALISRFSVVRFMDYLATNRNVQTNWSDRALPSTPSFNRRPAGYGWQGRGGAWEHVIELANETGRDAWINIPARATDAYVRNVALLFAYGSDGVNPYKSRQIDPVYPPLSPNLRLYVEYSNEVWNGGFTQFADNCMAASRELSAGNSPLDWDGSWNGVTYPNASWNWTMCNRHTTERSVRISDIFRSVFGDAAMMTRIRPVLMSQLGNAGAVLKDEADMLLDYYDDLGGNFVPDPHPPNYYFYGGGGSAYYNPALKDSTLGMLFADPGMNPSGFSPALKADAALIAAMGIERVAYEGGPSLDKTGGVRDEVSARAVEDPRMTRTVVDMHNAWSENGGGLLVYYLSTGDYRWGFTADVYNLSTPKLSAIDALNASRRAPLALGTPIPGSIQGKKPDACSRGWGCNPIQAWDYFTADGSKIVWASYSFRSSAPSSWTVSLSVSNADNARISVYVDGRLVSRKDTEGGPISFKTGLIGPGLHGVIVDAASGTFRLDSVSVARN